MRSGSSERLIPPSLRFDPHNPGVGREGGDAAGLSAEAAPSSRCGDGDGIIIVEQAHRQEFLLEIEPDAFDRIELGPVGRQFDERDISGHLQALRAVPACTVEHEGDMIVGAKRFGECLEKYSHSLGIRVWQNECEGMICAGLNRCVNIGGNIALIAQARRTLTAFPPDVADAAFLANARFVLEIQAQPLSFVRVLKFFQNSSGSF